PPVCWCAPSPRTPAKLRQGGRDGNSGAACAQLRHEGVITVALALEGKKAIVAEVSEAAKDALSVVVADSRGVTVEKMTSLRKQARENGVQLRVVRNKIGRASCRVRW